MTAAGGISAPSNLPEMKVPLFLRASLLAVLMVGWMAAPALAAPTVLSTSPEEGAEMHEPPGEVTIEFSEPLQDSSGLIVRDGCGKKVSEGDGRIVGTAMNELNVIVGSAPHHGTYTVEYVATGVSGTATGSYKFIVHGGTDCGGSEGDGSGGGGSGGHGGGHGTGDGDGDDGGGGGGGGGDTGGNHGDGHGQGDGDHDGDHDGSGAMQDGSGDADHSGMDMSQHGEHQDMTHNNRSKKNRHGDHERGRHQGRGEHGRGNDGGGNPTLATGNDARGATDIPTGSTVVTALGLAILMGVVGGWVLRVSTPS